MRLNFRQAFGTLLGPAFMVLAMAAVLALGLPSGASAQAVTGTLLGNVTDSSGGAVPGATVTATEVQTNVSRTVVSNESRLLHLLQPSERHLRGRGRAAGLQEGRPAERQGRREHDRSRRPRTRSRPDDRSRHGRRRDARCCRRTAPTPAASSNRRWCPSCR